MYSLNAPVPSTVAALASDLAADLPGARPRERGTHTLVAKRLRADDRQAFQRRAELVREALAGTPPFEVTVTGVDLFETVPTGTAPVVYLPVESPELEALHAALCEVIDPLADLEGDGYVPHVTVARGGSLDRARALVERDIDPIEWPVDELVFWDAERDVTVRRLSLPV